MFEIDARTIRGQAKLAGLYQTTSILILALSAILFGLFELWTIDELSESSARTQNQILPLQGAILEMRFEVVQVQQFLSDISATRGLDGLDDGIQKAEEAANRFQDATAVATNHAHSLGLGALVAAIGDSRAQLNERLRRGGKRKEALGCGREYC